MNVTTTNTNINVPITGLLTIAFVVLKLLDVIQWSWWWVLSPIWISTGLALILVVILWIFLKNKKVKK
jgi:hypothetical protein